MKKLVLLTTLIPAFMIAAATSAAEPTEADEGAKTVEANAAVAEREWPVAWFEIFKLAPGRHEAFMRDIAKADEVSRAGGLPPIQMFIHDTGAEWDVLFYKPSIDVELTPEQEAAMAAKSEELNMPSGPAYWLNIRKNIASHTDSKTYGPVTAAEWIARLEKWRSEHPDN